MKNYELIYVLKPNLDEETKAAALNKVKDVVATDGEIVSIDEWGNKKLAYPISKVTEGYYVLVNFKANRDLPKEVDRNLKINENVIRHMIIAIEG